MNDLPEYSDRIEHQRQIVDDLRHEWQTSESETALIEYQFESGRLRGLLDGFEIAAGALI